MDPIQRFSKPHALGKKRLFPARECVRAVLHPHFGRRLLAFTLLEMMIVIGIVASMLVLALPALFRPMGKTELQEAAKQIQASLLEARARAIESGVPQIFRYEPNGRRYEIVSDEESDNATASLSTVTPSAASTGSSASQTSENGAAAQSASLSSDKTAVLETFAEELPGNVVFIDPKENSTIDLSTGNLNVDSSPIQTDTAGNRWSGAIRFGSDGRSINTRLVLRGEKSWFIDILLRGPMGTSLIGEPRHEEETSMQPESQSPTESP